MFTRYGIVTANQQQIKKVKVFGASTHFSENEFEFGQKVSDKRLYWLMVLGILSGGFYCAMLKNLSCCVGIKSWDAAAGNDLCWQVEWK